MTLLEVNRKIYADKRLVKYTNSKFWGFEDQDPKTIAADSLKSLATFIPSVTKPVHDEHVELSGNDVARFIKRNVDDTGDGIDRDGINQYTAASRIFLTQNFGDDLAEDGNLGETVPYMKRFPFLYLKPFSIEPQSQYFVLQD